MKVRPALVALLALVLVPSVLAAGDAALLRLDGPGLDRNALLAAGVPVSEELGGGFFAVGEPQALAGLARPLGARVAVVDLGREGREWLVASLREGHDLAELATCGEVVWSAGRTAVVGAAAADVAGCLADPRWMSRPLRREALRPWRQAPTAPERLEVKPLVQQMVAELTQADLVGDWTDIVTSASERFSDIDQWGGCLVAAELVRDRLVAAGLPTGLETYRSGWAPNVVAELPGVTHPEQVYVAIGHLDDSSGWIEQPPAPGADDNASGAAMVVALAEVMSRYRFASTVRFVAVTGEEQGLVGSEAYASAAAAAGDQILGVLNADMIAWEGNGVPATGENLDLIYNSASSALLATFVQAAADYATGCPVNALLCGDMQQSDHWPFWSAGYPALCGITDDEGICGSGGSYPYYHSANDTIANCGDTGFFTAATRAYLATLAHLADPLCAVPAAPTGLSAAADGDNRVALAWSAAGAGFQVEVLRAPGGCAGPLAWVSVGTTTATALVDTTASGGVTYAYAVRALDGACASPMSACVEAATTGACTEPPGFAGVATVGDGHDPTCTLTVSWSPATPYCGGGASYSVYRSTTPGFVPGDGNRVAQGLAGTSWVDTGNLASREPVYYVVRATDLGNGVEDANAVEAGGAPTGPYAIGTWSDDGGDTGSAGLEPTAPWSLAATGGHDGPAVYRTGSYGDNLCAGLATPPLRLGSGATLTFWSKHDLESGWDKGVVQLSTDGGGSWARVEVAYPASSSYTSDACGLPAGTYFTGSGLTWAEYSASLAAWADKDVVLRWALSSDGSMNGTGWWVDDVAITQVMVPGECEPGLPGQVFVDGFEGGTTGAWSATTP